MPTLILSPRHSEDSQSLWRAASELGWEVERLPSWRVPEHFLQLKEPVLYVEALFAPTVAEQFGLQLLEPPVNWLPSLPEVYRKRQVEMMTLAQARLLPSPAFIRPPNDKSFPAKVYAGSELPEGYDEQMPVLVAEIVHWEKEFRCFVLDRQVKTLSIYLRKGELQRDAQFFTSDEEQQEALRFAQAVLADPSVNVPRSFVLDVGVISGRGWAVVELNTSWGAGIYGCDPKMVLEVIRHSTHAEG